MRQELVFFIYFWNHIKRTNLPPIGKPSTLRQVLRFARRQSAIDTLLFGS